MTSETKQSLSLIQKLVIVGRFFWSLGLGLKSVIFHPLKRGVKPGIGFQFANVLTRNLISSTPPDELAALLGSDEEVYEKWMKSKGYVGDIEVIPGADPAHKATLFWLEKRYMSGSKGKVIFNVHGGGFEFPALDNHFGLCDYLRKGLEEAGVQNVSAALLAYGVTPKSKYPTQFFQAVTALKHLVEEEKLSPKDIIIVGDSAGGHILLSVLSHVLHPYPGLPELNLHTPFATAILISPALEFDSKAASLEENKDHDIVSQHLLRERWWNMEFAGTSYLGDLEAGKYHGNALLAPAEWWNGMGKVVDRMQVVMGNLEVMRDDILAWAKTIENTEGLKFECVNFFNETHDGPYIDFTFNWAPGESSQLIKKWTIAAWMTSE